MKKIIKVYLLTLLFLCVSQVNFAQNDVPSTPEAKREALLTPQYYTNWIGASFFTISTIEHELDVTPIKITGLTFFYDFGSCFVGMEANEKGVVTQMTLRLFGGQANDFIQKAKDYGYELFDKGKNLVIHSNTGELLPDLYESKVKVYRKETKNGKTVWQSLLWYKRLNAATEEQRNDYEIDDEGIHWYALDEDISFESFEYDNPEPQGISRVFLTHPELNASAVARRVGISQSLMAQYINGMKKPSKERENLILNEVKTIGKELVAM